jgi:hypothetical protein
MTRYALLNDLTKAHCSHLLRESQRARRTTSVRGFDKFPAILRSLLLALA